MENVNAQTTAAKEQPSVGKEIMRVGFSSNPIVRETKEKFAELFDFISNFAMAAERESDTPPAIHSPETIQKHMETIRRNEEAIRCFAEACKILETSCMYAVKGLTS